MTRVKICGMKDSEDLRGAALSGADAVGFVVEVPSSKRSLRAEEARALIDEVPVFMTSVSVIVPDDIDEAVNLALKTGADLLQVHGDLGVDGIRKLKSRVPQKIVAALSALPGSEEQARELSEAADALLLDTYSDALHGGTGQAHDWEISARIASLVKVPVILAGGLAPENVDEAIRRVRPYAVDVSSGVETNGQKDKKKMDSFVGRVRACQPS